MSKPDDFPDFEPILITPDEARRINEAVDRNIGKLDDERVTSLVNDLQRAGAEAKSDREFLTLVARIVTAAISSV